MVGKQFVSPQSGVSVTSNATGRGRQVSTISPARYKLARETSHERRLVNKIILDEYKTQLDDKTKRRSQLERRILSLENPPKKQSVPSHQRSRISRQALRDLKEMRAEDGNMFDISSILGVASQFLKGNVDFGISFVHLLVDLFLARSGPQHISAIVHFLRDILSPTDLKMALYYFSETMRGAFSGLQEGEMFGESFVNSAHDFFKLKANACKTGPWKALVDLLTYVMSLLIGIAGENTNVYISKVKPLVSKPMDFSLSAIESLATNLIYVLKQGYQAVKAGCVLNFFFEETSLNEWFAEDEQLRLDLLNVNSPDPQLRRNGKAILASLEKHILKGTDLKKLLDPVPKRLLSDKIAAAKMAHNALHNSVVSGQKRKAPLVLLLNSIPGTGKTTFLDVIESFYASVTNHELSDEAIYTRQFSDDFWSGLKTTAWCVVLDDIAYESPNKISSLRESSLGDLIQLANNVVMCPNMASLEEKGKVFCMPELVLATTNCKHLNAHALFETPYAVQRRFPYVITISVKDEFSNENEGLDSSTLDGSLDYWNILVEIPRMARDSGRIYTRMVAEHRFDSINAFRVWLKKAILEHDTTQNAIMNSTGTLRAAQYCEDCCALTKGEACACQALPFQTVHNDELPAVLNGGVVPEDGVFHVESFFALLSTTGWASAFTVILCGLLWPFVCPWSWGAAFVVFVTQSAILYSRMSMFVYAIVYCTSFLPYSLQRIIFRVVSEYYGKKIGIRHTRIVGYMLALSSLMSLYTAYTYYTSWNKVRAEIKDKKEESVGDWHLREKSSRELAHRNGPQCHMECPARVETEGGTISRDVYYNDVDMTVAWDVGAAVTSWKALSPEDVIGKVASGVVRIRCHSLNKSGNGIFVSGQILLTNFHLFAGARDFEISMENGLSTWSGIMTVPDCDVVEREDLDLMAIYLRSVPPRKRLLKIMPKSALKDARCAVHIVTRTRDASLKVHSARSCRWDSWIVDHPFFQEPRKFSGYVTSCQTTQKGDCGAPYVAFLPIGPCLVALHQAADHDVEGANVSTGVSLTQDMVSALIAPLGPQVQGGSIIRPTYPLALTPLSKNSNFRQVEDAHGYVFGTSRSRFPGASHVRKSLIYDDCVNFGMLDEFSAPHMRGRKIWINNIREMVVRDLSKLDCGLLDKATDMYISETVHSLDDFSQVRVLSWDEAVNGVDGEDYVDKIPRKTSAGFPHNKTKMNFLEIDAEGRAIVADIIMDDARAIEEIVCDGRRSMPIFQGSMKDEVISITKFENHRTRMFTGSPFAFTIVMRKYLLSLNAHIQSNRRVYECCVGVDALGPEWDDIGRYLRDFSDDMIAGDYKNYDKGMIAPLILAAGKVFLAICEKAHYTKEQLLAVKTLVYDLAFPVCNIDGDIVMTCGAEPSGHPLTVIVNSIVGSILLRMAYIRLNTGKMFKSEVRAIVYGDDNLMASQNAAFNHCYLQDFFATQGLTYTMAEKEAESVPFITFEESTFLKRDFFFHPDLCRIVGRLSEKSIRKMLMYILPSNAVDEPNQLVDTLDTSCREMFFYGRQAFERHRDWCIGLIQKHALAECAKKSHFKDYDQLMEWYQEKVEDQEDSVLRTFRTLEGGCLSDEDIAPCRNCLNVDCSLRLNCTRVCRRCKHCRFDAPCPDDMWFGGCLFCEDSYPLWCDCCHDSDIKFQVHHEDGMTKQFYCYDCFHFLQPRSSYTVLKKQSNGSYRRDPVVHVPKQRRLSNEEFSL